MKTKQQKQSIIENLRENINKAKAVIILNLHKLNTPNLFKLKKELKNNESAVKVAKKTLFDIVNPEFGKEKIQGPFALIFDFSKNFKPFGILGKLKKELQLEIFGGFIGNKILTEKDIWDITSLPSEDMLRAKLVYTLKSQIQSIMLDLKSPLNKLVITLNQINAKKSAA